MSTLCWLANTRNLNSTCLFLLYINFDDFIDQNGNSFREFLRVIFAQWKIYRQIGLLFDKGVQTPSRGSSRKIKNQRVATYTREG